MCEIYGISFAAYFKNDREIVGQFDLPISFNNVLNAQGKRIFELGTRAPDNSFLHKSICIDPKQIQPY